MSFNVGEGKSPISVLTYYKRRAATAPRPDSEGVRASKRWKPWG